MATIQRGSMSIPDETRTFPHGKLDLVHLEGLIVGRIEAQPGWRWSEHVKPIAGTASCQASHAGVQLSGRLRVRMDDGTEQEYGPGDVYVIPPGHDAWVVGDEPMVGIDVTGMGEYAKPS